MTTVTLSKTLLDKDLSNLFTYSQADEIQSNFGEDLTSILGEGYKYNNVPSISNNGRTETYKNITFDGYYGSLSMGGSAVINYDEVGNTAFASFSFNSPVYMMDGGKLTASVSLTGINNKDTHIYKFTTTGSSYVGDDGAKWSIKESVSLSYYYNYYTETEKRSYSNTITSFSSSDADGNSISFSGSYRYNNTTEEYRGYMTSIALKIGGTSLNATGLKITKEELLDGWYSFSLLSEALPTFLAGNDTITVSSTDTPEGYAARGYVGNDKLIGSSSDDELNGGDGGFSEGSGNDTLIGGAGTDFLHGEDGNDTLDGGVGDDLVAGDSGSDKLTGGKGADTFIFWFEDYDFSNLSSVAVDTVTDFKIAEGDIISLENFGGEFGIVANKVAGLAEEYQLFYDKSSGTVYYDPEYDGNPVAIIKLTGIPKITDANVGDVFYLWQ